MVPTFVLASASPARLRLLRGAGLDPVVEPSGVVEDDADLRDVAAAALALARSKARAVAGRRVEGLVLGCDSLFDLDGVALGKPTDDAEALDRLRALRGRTGLLHTGHCLCDAATGVEHAEVVTTPVRMGMPSDAELAAYVATGEPLQVAGGVTIDGRSAPFVEAVEGDWSNVVGLSLPMLRELLARHDVALTDLWV